MPTCHFSPTFSRRSALALATALGGLAVAGCDADSPMHYVEAGDFSLDGAKVALRFCPAGPNHIDMPFAKKHGFLTLLDDSATARTLPLEAQDVSSIIWNAEMLFVSDEKKECRISDQTLVRDNIGAGDYGISMLDLGGGTIFSGFNIGSRQSDNPDEEYLTGLSTSTKESIQYRRDFGYISNLASDGTRVFGLLQKTHETGESEYSLVQAFPKVKDRLKSTYHPEAKESVSDLTSDGTDFYSASVVALDRSGNDGEFTTSFSVLRFKLNPKSTDTSSFTVAKVDMKSPQGDPVIVKSNYPSWICLPGSIQDAAMHWLDFNGDVWRTELATGVTNKAFAVDAAGGKMMSTLPKFDERGMFLARQNTFRQSGTLDIEHYELATGRKTLVASTDVFKGRVSEDVILRDFAINPKWQP